jgi:hypothetical protein
VRGRGGGGGLWGRVERPVQVSKFKKGAVVPLLSCGPVARQSFSVALVCPALTLEMQLADDVLPIPAAHDQGQP